jgi:hypothetical protein
MSLSLFCDICDAYCRSPAELPWWIVHEFSEQSNIGQLLNPLYYCHKCSKYEILHRWLDDLHRTGIDTKILRQPCDSEAFGRTKRIHKASPQVQWLARQGQVNTCGKRDYRTFYLLEILFAVMDIQQSPCLSPQTYQELQKYGFVSSPVRSLRFRFRAEGTQKQPRFCELHTYNREVHRRECCDFDHTNEFPYDVRLALPYVVSESICWSFTFVWRSVGEPIEPIVSLQTHGTHYATNLWLCDDYGKETTLVHRVTFYQGVNSDVGYRPIKWHSKKMLE